MANHNATGKKTKHGHEMVQRCRAAILSALDIYEKKNGKLISEVLADEFIKNPMKFMELASKYCPKELDGEITLVKRAMELTDDELADIATGSSTGATSQASEQEKSTPVH